MQDSTWDAESRVLICVWRQVSACPVAVNRCRGLRRANVIQSMLPYIGRHVLHDVLPAMFASMT